MDSGSFRPLLDRDRARVENWEKIEKQSAVLKRLVDDATLRFIRCWQYRPDRSLIHYSLFFLHRHVMEMTDGVEQLISGSCFGAAIPLVRSCFEAHLSMDFIMEKDYDMRSLAWLNNFIHKMLDETEMLDPTTARGKNLVASIKNDRFLPFVLPEMQTDYAREASELITVLAQDEFVEIEKKREKLRQDKRMRFWCQLCDDCQNITKLVKLAEYLRRVSEHRILYRRWSEISHAFNAARFVTRVIDGRQSLRPLRNPDVGEESAHSAANYMGEATSLLLRRFRPDELLDYEQWFESEIARPLTV